jgi:hypothetical protein
MRQFVRTAMTFHVLSGMMYQFASDLGQSGIDDLLVAGLLGPTASFPLFGDVLERQVRKAFGLSPYQDSNLITGTINDGFSGASEILSGEGDSRSLSKVANASQLGAPLPAKWITELANSLVTDIPEGDIHKFLGILIGGSRFAVDKGDE